VSYRKLVFDRVGYFGVFVSSRLDDGGQCLVYHWAFYSGFSGAYGKADFQEVDAMSTALIFATVFFTGIGYLTGLSFKGLNPFKMVFGLILIAATANAFAGNTNHFLLAGFVLGFIYAYDNPFRWLFGLFDDARMSWQLAKARHDSDREYQRQELEAQSRANDTAHQQEMNDLRRQKENAEADLRRQQGDAEELKQAFERLKREKEAAQNKQQQQGSSNFSTGLDPTKYADACKILGVPQGSSVQDCKAAYRHLSTLFHPDKFARSESVLKTNAAESLKMINVAWETIKKS
jgi:hypothetical protein